MSSLPDLAFRRGPLAAVAAAAVAAGILGTAWSHAVAPIPWLVAIVAVGLPHGATDLSVSRRLCPPAARLRVWIAYLAMMAATVMAFTAAPALVVGGFIVVSAWHFGLPHGGIAVGVPLFVWPAASGRLGDRLLELTGHAPLVPAFPEAAVGAAGAGLVATGIAVAVINAARAARPVSAAVSRNFGELAALAGLGLVADPLFSVGLTFLAWHAWRQMEPLATIVTGAAPTSPQSLARSLVAIHAAALPLLVPTWIAIAYGWWRLSPDHSAVDLAILSIAAYLVVTPAHEALGAAIRSGMLDRCGPGAKPTRPLDVAQPPSIARCAETSAPSSG
jgi:Brp/Blh family beta-carotene 15,15'-monooxygenase